MSWFIMKKINEKFTNVWIPFLIFNCFMYGLLFIFQGDRIMKIEADVREIKRHTHTHEFIQIEYGEWGIIEDGISFPYARMPALESDPE